MSKQVSLWVILLVAVTWAQVPPVNAQLNNSNSIPVETNLLTTINVQAILQSQYAQNDGWYAKMEERFQNGSALIPPNVNSVTIASHVHPFIPERVWAVTFISQNQNTQSQHFNLASIAQSEHQSIETIEGLKVVRTNRNGYYIDVGNNDIAIYRPAHRQDMVRWLRESATNLSGGFMDIASAMNSPAHITMTLDLKDLIDPVMARRYLQEDKRFSAYNKLIEKLVTLVSDANSLQLRLNFAEKIKSEIQIDFKNEVGASGPNVKTILLSILDDMGVTIEEFAQADLSTQGQSVILKADLSDESFRLILSLIDSHELSQTSGPPNKDAHAAKIVPPVPQSNITPPPAETSTPSRRTNIKQKDPTQDYVKAVNQMLDDLERVNRRATANSNVSGWHDNFAKKIEGLNTQGVEPDALKYGSDVAMKLRMLASSLRGQAIDLNTLQQSLVYNYNYDPGYVAYDGWGWWGGYQPPHYNYTSNLQEVREKQAEAVSSSAKQREQIWLSLRDNRAAAARKFHISGNDATPGKP
jgi:hypothetical protein